jgi:hypothetical protein
MLLGSQQIYEFMRTAGFPQKIAVTMTAIALRESAGDPTVVNNNTETGDRSYGLLQINMLDENVREDIYKSWNLPVPVIPDILTESKLLDPLTNAKAAFLLYGGSVNNLNIAWYIKKQPYQTKYEVHLPEAQNAALMSAL